MSYLLRNKNKPYYRRPAALLVGIFFLGLVISRFFDGLLISLVSPLWRAENSFSRKLNEFSRFFKTKQSLSVENVRLKERVSSLELEVSNLSINRTGDIGGILANVLTQPPQTPYDVLIIDRTVPVGSKIYLPEGALVGEVVESFSKSARVKLFTGSGDKTNAILERNNLPVVLEGVGAGSFRIEVPRETPVEAGDRIVSPDRGSQFMGVVESVKVTPTDSFKEILARSPINIFNLRSVIIESQ